MLGILTYSVALVPLCDVLCEVTGLNGKIELEATTNQNLETEIGRDVSIQFVSHNNEQMPWIFRPSESQIKIQTGKYHTATFYVKNPTNKRMIAQAIPSVAPSNAASHLKKLECFCFEEQELEKGEEEIKTVRLKIDEELKDSIKRVVLYYKIFDVTEYKDLEMTDHHDGHEMEASL